MLKWQKIFPQLLIVGRQENTPKHVHPQKCSWWVDPHTGNKFLASNERVFICFHSSFIFVICRDLSAPTCETCLILISIFLCFPGTSYHTWLTSNSNLTYHMTDMISRITTHADMNSTADNNSRAQGRSALARTMFTECWSWQFSFCTSACDSR